MSTTCCSNFAPSSFSSLNPADRIMNALVPFCSANNRTVSGQNLAAIAKIAISTCGKSAGFLKLFTPCTSSSLGFATYKSPLKLPSIRFFNTFPPGFCILSEPPTTTILLGSRSCFVIIIIYFYFFCVFMQI